MTEAGPVELKRTLLRTLKGIQTELEAKSDDEVFFPKTFLREFDFAKKPALGEKAAGRSIFVRRRCQ